MLGQGEELFLSCSVGLVIVLKRGTRGWRDPEVVDICTARILQLLHKARPRINLTVISKRFHWLWSDLWGDLWRRLGRAPNDQSRLRVSGRRGVGCHSCVWFSLLKEIFKIPHGCCRSTCSLNCYPRGVRHRCDKLGCKAGVRKNAGYVLYR